jgi:hypothetical protein
MTSLVTEANLMVATGPVVSGSSTVVSHKHILMVVEVAVLAVLNAVDHSWLQINEQRPRNVVLIVRLVEEHVLAIASLY